MAQIKTSVDEILRIVRESKADSKSVISDVKRQRIMDVVYDRFDFRAMSQLAMARNWKAITAKEQDRFVTLFAKVLENTYYDRINSYSGEVILFKEQELKDDKAVVSSVVVKNNTETPVVYRLRSVGGKWMVYDVIIEGVSLVRNYRTQFDSIIEKEKYDGLIRRLEEKIAKKETN
ncbi:MAG: ABC transporter substrate-binding protein [Desulfobulbaceae bacterium]|nr:ABC transporter substrate-binding protein [Desulfobulbaceae bacterium]